MKTWTGSTKFSSDGTAEIIDQPPERWWLIAGRIETVASPFTESVCSLLEAVPPGKVVTYGSLAAAAGSPRAARQVVRILHTQAGNRNLPWHRVVASGGRVALEDSRGGDLQRQLLMAEGVEFGLNGRVDLQNYEWSFDSQSGN